jgi:hypothetical protein
MLGQAMGVTRGKMRRKTTADYYLDKNIAGAKSSFSAFYGMPLKLF